MRPVSIRSKFVRDLVLMVVLMGVAVMLVFWLGNRRAVRTLSASIIRQTLQTTEQELASFFEPVMLSLRVAQSWGEEGDLSLHEEAGVGAPAGERLATRFIPVIQRLPQISSLLVADETGREFMLLHTAAGFEVWQNQPQPDGTLERHRVWSDHNADLSVRRTDYDPRVRPWFVGASSALQEAESSGADQDVFWTEPYTFFTTAEPGITAAVALRDPAGRRHVIGFDVLLRDISQFTRTLRVSERGKVVVMTTDNLVVGLPDDARFDDPVARQSAYLKAPEAIGLDLARDATTAFGDAVVEALKEHRDPQSTTVRFKSLGEAWWGESRLFTLSPARHLRMAVVVPEAELLGDLLTQRLIIALVLMMVLLIGVWRAIILGRTLSTPVEQLVAQTDRIGQGDLGPAAPIRTDISEVRRLAAAHDRMRDSLRSLMKLERDIQIARQIQQSTFPKALPSLEGFDLDAWSEPADETGGDTFDVIGFTLDAVGITRTAPRDKVASPPGAQPGRADRALLLLADATGHGIGPALAATQVRAMLRMAVRLGANLREIAQQLNEQLVADLPDNRFITAWLGAVDARDGTLVSFSAGQGPLLLYRAAKSAIDEVATDAPPFGVVPDLDVQTRPPLRLARGDVFVVLSDGLFEARCASGGQFGLERMKALICQSAALGASAMTNAIRSAVEEFTGYAPADDDRTIIVIRRTA